MDIQAIASQLVGYLGDNPELISQFVEHPYSTTAEVVGTDERISKEDMSQIVTQVAAQSTDQSINSTDTANIASALMGANGGSVHALTSALFGGGAAPTTPAPAEPSTAEPAASDTASPLGSMVDLGGIVSTLFGGKAAQGQPDSMAQIAAKSLAGGAAARGVASLLAGALGGAAAKPDAETGAQAQTDAGQPAIPDFSMLADLAKSFLGK